MQDDFYRAQNYLDQRFEGKEVSAFLNKSKLFAREVKEHIYSRHLGYGNARI